MTIEFFKIEEGEPAQQIMPMSGQGLQAVVSCQGDIAVLTYGPNENSHGVAWLILEQGPNGEPGRETMKEECPEKMEPRMLQDIEGVLIGAMDYRSLNALIASLVELRDRLMSTEGYGAEVEIIEEAGRRMVEEIQAETDRCLLDALKDPNPVGALLDIATEKAKKRGESSNDGS